MRHQRAGSDRRTAWTRGHPMDPLPFRASRYSPVLMCLLTAWTAWAGEVGQVRGRVLLASDRSPLPGATVRVEHTPWVAVSDERGEFTFLAVPPGLYTVTCTLEGFVPYQVTGVAVRADSVTEVTCLLRLAGASVVEVYGVRPVDPTNPATYHVITRPQSKASIPPDIFSQAKLIPGVVQNGEVLDYVFIRGTPQRATALSIEGLDARNAVHMTTGVPVFAKGALESIEVITGSMAPEYGNAIGGVLNTVVSGGEGERGFYGDLAFTSTDASFFDRPSRQRDQRLLQTEVGWNPNERWGLKLAFADYGGNAMPWTYQVNENFVDFYDFWLIGRWQPSARSRWKFVYERARGAVRFHSGPTQEGRVVPSLFWQTRPHENDTFLLTWYGQVGSQTVLSWQAGYLRTFDGSAPTLDGDRQYLTRDQVVENALRSGGQRRLWDYWPEITFYESRRYQSRLSLETLRWTGHDVKTVLDVQYLRIPEGYYWNAQPVWAAAVLGCPGDPRCPLPPFVQPRHLLLAVDYAGSGLQVGWAVQDFWTLRPGLRWMYGLRVDYWSFMETRWAVSPRTSLVWQAGPGTVLKFSAGLFAQPVPPAAAFLREQAFGLPISFAVLSGLFPELVGPTAIWTRSYVMDAPACRSGLLRGDLSACRTARTDMKPERAWHLEMEFGQALGPAWTLRVNPYYRRLWDMLFNGRGFTHPAGQDVGDRWPLALVHGGRGRAYGVEVSLLKTQGALRGWISYSYAVAEGTFPSADYRGGGLLVGDFRPLNFDVRHQVQVSLDWSTAWAGGLTVHTDLQWNTGYPTTRRYWRLWTCQYDLIGLPPPGALPIGPQGCIYVPDLDPTTGLQRQGLFNAERMPALLKWDLKVEKTLVRHGPARLHAVFQVDNLLNRKNYGTWTTEQNSYREVDAETGRVIAEGARLADRRFQLGLRLTW
jgi:hypothetical protein